MSRGAPRPLARSLALNYAVTALIPLAVISALVMFYLSRATVDDVTEKNMLIARAVSGQVEVFLDEPLTILGNIAGTIASTETPQDRRIGWTIETHARNSDLFESIFLLGPDGKVTAAGFRENGDRYDEDYLGLDLSHREFYRQARSSGRPTWSDTYLSLLTGRIAVSLFYPVGEQVLVGNFNLDTLSSFTERLSAGARVTTTIIDRQGFVIIHPDPLIAAHKVNLSNLLPVSSGLRGESGTFRYRFEDKDLLGSVAPVDGPGWLALVSQRYDDAYDPLRHTGAIMALGLVSALLLAVALGVVMARSFSRPLEEFAALAGSIAEGGYDFTWERQGIVEINGMAESFARMAAAIRDRESRLKENEEKYRLLVENANDAIFVAQDGVMKFLNRRTEEMTGYGAGELGVMPFADIVHPEDRDTVIERHRRRIQGDDVPKSYTFRIVHREGGVGWVMINSVLIDWEGRPATLNFVRDISEQKNLEVQVLQAQKLEAVGTLAGGIAHDFNNLLQAIQGYSEICLMQAEPNSQMHEDVEEIIKAVQRGGELTRQLLLFSRRVDSRVKPVDLNAEVERMARILKRILPKMIRVELDLSPGLKWVNADVSQIEQVLMNLAVNSRDAMPEGGKLTITTRNLFLLDSSADHPGTDPGEYVMISVADTGPGIDEGTLDRVFEPFFTTKEAGRGTGLGLAMVYGIVRNHDGNIACVSTPGKGATFRIYLPAIDAGEESVMSEARDQPRGGEETILLVDDEKSVLDVGEKILSTFGYKVLTADDGEGALEILRENPRSVDMVILDMIMPGMGGRQCLREMLAVDPSVKVLISSGFSSGGTTRDSIDAGAKGLVRKPYSVNHLLRAVRATLDGKLDKQPP